MEGPFVLRHGDWFYLFYSGNGCCGVNCDYALGVARARTLFGPWEKDPSNPILAGNETWKCPGHGSIVQDERGRYFFLYHACLNAWAHPISRLSVNTCTLDSPRALPLYQRVGFVPYAREERFVELLEGQKGP